MHNFFITGLPRSRTAWMANYFTSSNSFCYHEPPGTYLEIIEMFQKGRPELYIGLADCKLPYYFDYIAPSIPMNRLVIVERDLIESMESLWNCIDGDSVEKNAVFAKVRELSERLEKLKRSYQHMSVGYYDLDDIDTMEGIWEYLLPGQRFDEERFEMLDRFVIEPHYNKYDTRPMNIQKLMEGM